MAELIISDVRPRVQYTADGVQTSFPYPFPIFDQADLVVVFDDNGTPGANNITDVGVSGGGDVVFDSPPPLDTRITIYRDMAFARETDFLEAGDFRAAVINEELDRMAMLLQQAEMLVADSLHKPLYESDSDLILPSAATRAGKVLAFDDDGLPTIGSPSEEAATLAAVSATAAAASAAAAKSEADYVFNTAVPVQQLSGDGATLAFTLDRAVVDNTSIAITIDGVKQHTATYTAGGTTLTFTAAPPTGTDNIEVTFIGFTGVISSLAAIPDSFRNAVINGDFSVAQRGTSFVTPGNGTFTLDRWGSDYVGASGIALTISQQAFTAGQTDVPGEPEFFYRWDHTTAGTATELYPFQRIENVRSFAGQQCTLSFYAKADAARSITPRWTQDFGGGGSPDVSASLTVCNLTASWQKFTRTFTPTSISSMTINASSFLEIDFLLPTGTVMTIDLAEIQLEAGDVATGFERRPIAQERALCQRYFQRLNANGDRIMGQATGATTASLLWPFTVEMRASPTFSLATNGSVIRDVSSAEAVSGLSSTLIGTKHMVFNVNVAANLSAGDATGYIPGDITADAEL